MNLQNVGDVPCPTMLQNLQDDAKVITLTDRLHAESVKRAQYIQAEADKEIEMIKARAKYEEELVAKHAHDESIYQAKILAQQVMRIEELKK